MLLVATGVLKTTTRTWVAVGMPAVNSSCNSITNNHHKLGLAAPIIGAAGANATIECTATPVFTAPTATDAL
jgi:hypothetical protein